MTSRGWHSGCLIALVALVVIEARYGGYPAAPARSRAQLSPSYYPAYYSKYYHQQRRPVDASSYGGQHRPVQLPRPAGPPVGSPQNPIGAPGQSGASAPRPPTINFVAQPLVHYAPPVIYEIEYNYPSLPAGPGVHPIAAPPTISIDVQYPPSRPSAHDCFTPMVLNSKDYNCFCNPGCDVICRGEFGCE